MSKIYLLVGYKPCSTCREIEKLLKSKHLPYDYREITEDVPNGKELMEWYQKSEETSLKKIMNTSGTKYRDLGMKDQLLGKSEQEQCDLISQDGMLIKRPILITEDDRVFFGKAVKEFIMNL